MKKNIVASSILSAFLLTAAALPVSASSSTKPVEPGKVVNVQMTATAAKPMFNFLELVKQYAPETLQDWQDVLDKQKKHVAEFEVNEHSVTVTRANSVTANGVESHMLKDVLTAPQTGQEQAEYAIIATPSDGQAAITVTYNTKESQLFSDLDKAVEAKDAEAIKTNLAKILEQFKAQEEAFEKGTVE
ncbi:hypothetical protein [Paenibacillus guangzhouensis]|uniref:hypothetical protein n=1 Tax=Paenibacillus guangzhouensis TaxID=1473112 RepID=UPI00126709C5|nr:hypothetical protein [Paenibacillus guangzhouensis]